MTDLLLNASEQAAVRAVIASDPVPGATLPAECALAHLARLVDCDALGIALVDDTGSSVEEAALPRDGTAVGAAPTGEPVTLGLRRRDRAPAKDGSPGRRGASCPFRTKGISRRQRTAARAFRTNGRLSARRGTVCFFRTKRRFASGSSGRLSRH